MEVLEAWIVVNLEGTSYELCRGDFPGIYMVNEHPTCMELLHEIIPTKEDPIMWSFVSFFSLVLIYRNVVAGPLLVRILELFLFHVELCPRVGKSCIVQTTRRILV